MLKCWKAKMQNCWNANMLKCWKAKMQNCWDAEMLIYWNLCTNILLCKVFKLEKFQPFPNFFDIDS